MASRRGMSDMGHPRGSLDRRNRLLAALEPADFALLAPHLQDVPLEQDAVLMCAGERIEQVYFLHSGTVSLMVDMPNGETVAAAVIGREGAIGGPTVLGISKSFLTAIVQVPGTASQISASRFHALISQNGRIRQAVEAHNRVLMGHILQVAACNALHHVQARMARWLLHIHDRIDSNDIPLTQEALSQLLGVRRTTVTMDVNKLRVSGAVRHDRRASIEIIDRVRLEAAACECYDIMRRLSDQTMRPTLKPRIHHAPKRPMD
jgi:CRP-like cAMP-binding protein